MFGHRIITFVTTVYDNDILKSNPRITYLVHKYTTNLRHRRH